MVKVVVSELVQSQTNLRHLRETLVESLRKLARLHTEVFKKAAFFRAAKAIEKLPGIKIIVLSMFDVSSINSKKGINPILNCCEYSGVSS